MLKKKKTGESVLNVIYHHKINNIFHNIYVEKPIIILPLINFAPLIIKPIAKPTTKLLTNIK